MRGNVATRRFASIEALLDHVESEGLFVSQPQKGGEHTINKFVTWALSHPPFGGATERRRLVIQPDPTSFLLFPSIREELKTALPSSSNESLQATANRYGFGDAQLDQATFTLSGGERVRAALAKAEALCETTDELVLCSPTHWLNPTSYKYLHLLMGEYVRRGKSVYLFLLNGEDMQASGAADDSLYPIVPDAISNLTERENVWRFRASDFRLELDAMWDGDNDATLQFAFPTNGDGGLLSPTLLTGNNGVGKSVFAKCLGGMYASVKQDITVGSYHGRGHARLIMQDSLSHLFRKNIPDHATRIFDFDLESKKKLDKLFEEMCKQCRDMLWVGEADDELKVGPTDGPDTLMQAKILLVAERLIQSPPLLLVDEPGWGLSADQANAFVCLVTNTAHKLGIAVAFISHTTHWMQTPMRSRIHIDRDGSKVTVNIMESVAA
jgi:energy-coupling factor transporter ATP-binding protein EcfA2